LRHCSLHANKLYLIRLTTGQLVHSLTYPHIHSIIHSLNFFSLILFYHSLTPPISR